MTEQCGTVLHWGELDAADPLPGIKAVVAMGVQLSAAMFSLAGDAVVPEHTHDSEEFGQVISGSLELRCGGDVQVLVTGDAFIIPGGLTHGARALGDGCELLECYAPPRSPIPAAGPTS